MKRVLGIAGAVFVLTVLLAMFVVPGPAIATSSRIGEELVFATVHGRDAVVLAYEATGFGGLNTGTEGRVTAVDLATGETLWDEELPGRRYVPEVLAAGEEYAYVRHGDGLDVVSLTDGSTVVEAEDIEGLGDDRYDGIDVPSAYVYDREREVIVTVTRSGDVRAIAIDGTTAAPADAELVDTWSCVLPGGDHQPTDVTADTTVASVPRADGHTVTLARPAGMPENLPNLRLHESGPDDVYITDRRELAPDDYPNAGFLAEFVPNEPRRRACPGIEWHEDVYPRNATAVGRPAVLASGHAVIQSTTDVDTDDKVLTVVDLDTGERTATAEVDWGFDRALTAPSGQLVVTAGTFLDGPLNFSATTPLTDVLHIVDERGGLRRIVVGERGWFGLI